MSKSPTPKGTPVQRSPSDGVSEGLQSPQHSTPSIGPQHKKRISSLLQSPVRRLLASDLFFFFPLSLSRPLSALWIISSQMNKSGLKCHVTARVTASAGPPCWVIVCASAYGRAAVKLHDADEISRSDSDYELQGWTQWGWLIKYFHSPSPM